MPSSIGSEYLPNQAQILATIYYKKAQIRHFQSSTFGIFEISASMDCFLRAEDVV
jgi:hypothetical protein